MKPVNLRYGQTAWRASKEGHVIVIGRCIITLEVHQLDSVSTEGLLKWSNGMLIQEALPELSKEDREFLMSGISPEGWAQAKLDDEGDDDDLVPLEDLENADLEAIATRKGGNDLARMEAVAAQAILDRRAADHSWGRPAAHFRDI